MAKTMKSQSSRQAARVVRGRRADKAAPPGQAMPRSMTRGRMDGPATPRDGDADAVTRVTRETEVRGTETRVERVVERAPKPSLAGVDRTAGRGRYVYCVIRASGPLKFGAIGMDDQWPEVYAVNYKDMAAVVSDVPIVPLDSTRENVLAHERVNETVMRDHTVIPMSFGTIFKTREDIVELLRSAYEAFADVLNKMQDKLEFGLKVLWDRDEIVKV
ncbi:MAG: GvpL/GvpF family gas vesicle protein, partial [Acidobacteria bacterium]|nr:GvpL/GvpF family gas vesicle protein [Acidobacteriota bacterium]